MSYYHVSKEGVRRPSSRLVVALVVGGIVAALLSGWSATKPITVVVDGREQRVPIGATVSELNKQGLFEALPGNLIAVDGSVIATAAGEPAIVTRNGVGVAPGQRISRGDVLASRPGPHVRESLLTTETVVAYDTRFEGKGPIVELKQLGAPGLRRVTRGAISGIEVTSTVLVESVDTIFVHTRPRPGSKVVALTFDDGPIRGQTDQVLDILKKYEAKATFFFVGQYAAARPDMVRRTMEEGHQVANHSYSHPRLSGRTPSFVHNEIVKGDKAIRAITGRSSKYFRPPYGAMDQNAWDELKKLDQNVILWDVDPQDWKKPGVEKLVDDVVKNVRPGSIVLLHDGGPDRRQTIQALPQIIEKLQAKGYIFVTVEDLIPPKKQK